VLSNLHLGMLARNPPSNVGVIASIVRRGSPIATKRADQIFQVIQDAKADFAVSQQERAERKVAKSVSPRPEAVHTRLDSPEAIPQVAVSEGSETSAPTVIDSAPKPLKNESRTEDFGAVFSSVFGNSSTVASSSKPKPTAGSKLFGKTFSAKLPKAEATGAAAPQGRKATSSLFGSAAKRSKAPASTTREASPSFAEINQGILAELAPPKPAVVTDGDQSNLKVAEGLPEPETVPFVPASARTTTFIEAPDASSNEAPKSKPRKVAVPVKEPSPEPVVVKMTKKQRKREREAAAKSAVSEVPDMSGDAAVAASTSTADLAAADTEDAPPSSKKQKKEKKKKIAAEDIPQFDYTSVPNLLDNPEAATGGRKKKGKKDKKGGDKDQNRVGKSEDPGRVS